MDLVIPTVKIGAKTTSVPIETEKITPAKKSFWRELLGLSPRLEKPVVPHPTVIKFVHPDSKSTGQEKADKLAIQEAEKIYSAGLVSVKDLIAPSSVKLETDKLNLSGIYSRSFFVFDYPRYIEANWLSPIINYDSSFDLSMFVYPMDSAKIMKYLRSKVAQIRASISINAERGKVRDPALEAALQDAEELRDSLQKSVEKFFHFALYFTIYAEDEQKLNKISKQFETLLGGKLVLTKPTNLQMEHGFNACLPQATDEIGVFRNMNTGPLSYAFPFSSSDLTSNEGVLYGLNRHNDSLIIFDRFNLENANAVILAKSGAGKSYAVKLEILRSLMFGTDVMVIDPENEYEALSKQVGGIYLRVSLTSDKRINPFDLPAKIEGSNLKTGDILRSTIITLHGLMALMLGKLTPQEESIMDKALIDTYALKGITFATDDLSKVESPLLDDLWNVLKNMAGGEELAQRVEKFTTGSFGGIFNKPTNLDLENGLLVFCIRDLEDKLRPIAMYIILNFIWNKIRSQLKKRILIIDEAWNLVQYEDSARFLYALVKRARKYYLGISAITQDVEDFISSKWSKPIITNSSLQLLLRQSPAAIETITQIFNLTEGEKLLLLNSAVGQGLFFAGNQHVAIQIIASYNEHQTITTNPEEILTQRKKEEEKEE